MYQVFRSASLRRIRWNVVVIVGLALLALTVHASFFSDHTLSDSQATIVGSAIGAVFSVLAALIAVRLTAGDESRKLRHFVRVSIRGLAASARAIGDLNMPKDEQGNQRFSDATAHEFIARVDELRRQSESAGARLAAINAVAYKLDEQTLDLLLYTENQLLQAVRGLCAIAADYHEKQIIAGGHRVPVHLARAAGVVEGAACAIESQLAAH